MVNITYDASGQLNWFNPVTGKTVVYNGADIAWTLSSTVLVWIMIPGLGFLYCGNLRSKNGLSMIYLSVGTIAVVSFQWFFWGFSLVFSDTASRFIGDLRHFGLMEVLETPSVGNTRVPSIVYCVFQMMFATVTPMIAIGAIAERGRLGPALVFVFIWATVVYDPIACWTWNKRGWANTLGVLDFAGGTPVHIAAGTTALAISYYLRPRENYGTPEFDFRAHNTTYVILGTIFLWFGWFGFNGGSTLSANLRAAQACIVTNLAAGVGGTTWMLWEHGCLGKGSGKWSAVAFCSGAISGLVAITPGSGFVGAPAAVLFGVTAGTFCKLACGIKFMLNCDDTLDIFAVHAIGGLIGNILTGVFAQESIAGLDGRSSIPGGWLDHHWVQIGLQLANSVAALVYSGLVTTVILWVMDKFPGGYLRLRCDENTQRMGMDYGEMGEAAYDYSGIDYSLDFRIRKRQPRTADTSTNGDHRGDDEDPAQAMRGGKA